MAKFEEVRYVYNIPHIGIYESTHLIEGLELTSIKTLEEELFDQGSLLKFIQNTCELHEDSSLQDYAGRGNSLYYIVCKEGVYSYEDGAYQFVGKFKKGEIKRTKYVSIPNDIFVRKDGDLILVNAGHHEILHCEEIEIDDGKQHLIFEIATEEQAFTKLKIPNYPGVFLIFDCDLLEVESLINSECESGVY